MLGGWGIRCSPDPTTSTIPMISRICPTSCSEILVWISSEVHQLCGFCPTGVREADCSSRLLWSAPVHLWDVVDSSSPAFLLSSPAPKSNPSAHSKCTCSCLPFTQGLEVLGGWGIRCSPDPTTSTIPMISRICPTSCSEILVWISSEVHQLCGFCPTGVREADCSSRLLWSVSTLLNLHCRSISRDYSQQTTGYRYVYYCTRRCNVLFAASLYFPAIYVYCVSCALTGKVAPLLSLMELAAHSCFARGKMKSRSSHLIGIW